MDEIFRKIEDNIFESQERQEKNQNLYSKDISDDVTEDSSKDTRILKKISKTEAKNKKNTLSLKNIENKGENEDEKEEKIDEDEYADYGRVDKTGIHFQIISDYNVSIEIVPEELLSNEIKDLILKYKGVFDTKMNLWVVPYVNYELLYSELYKIEGINKLLHKVGSIAKECYEHKNLTTLIIKRKKKEETIDYLNDTMERNIESLPQKLRDALYDFQVEGVKFGIEHHCRFLLADEMGVGKTIQAISLAYIYRDSWPVLIICPGSMKYLWKGEIQNWLGLKDKRINIINSSRQKLSQQAYFYIISYDLVRRIQKKLKEMIFDFVILDEAHALKNKESYRAKNILPIALRAKRLILMTGTPLLAKPFEGYPLLYALRPDLFCYFKKFAYRYCDPQPTPFGITWSGTSNTKELHWILSTLMVRRLKKDVLNKLPPKRRQKVLIKTDPKIIAKIRETRTAVKGRTGTLESYTLTATAKKEGVCEYIYDILDTTDEKIIVFGYHHEMLDSIESLSKKNKIDYIRIDGSTKQDKRYEYVNYFQKNKNCRVAILSIIAASTGITLNAAHIVIFAELTWTPSIMIQAEDRAHRIGQKSEFVDIKYLYGQETLDDFILDKLQKKLTIVSTTIDDKRENFGVKANPELIHARNSQELIENDKGENYYSDNYDNKEDKDDDDESIDEKNIEKIMMSDLDLDYDSNVKGKNHKNQKKNNIKNNNKIKINNENKNDINININKYLKNKEIKYPKNDFEINKNDDKRIYNKSRNKDKYLKINNSNFNDNNNKELIYQKESNLNDLKIKKYKYPKEDDSLDNEDTKSKKLDNKDFKSLRKRGKTTNASDGKKKYNTKLSSIKVLKKAWVTNNKKSPYNYKKIFDILYDDNSSNASNDDELINNKVNSNKFKNDLKEKDFNNDNKKIINDKNIENDNKNFIDKLNNEEKINKIDYFKNDNENLLINLHKVNMRRTISQEEETKQTQTFDLDDKPNEKFKTEQKRFLFTNNKKKIFNENYDINKNKIPII